MHHKYYLVAVDRHGTIALVVHHRASRGVHRNLMMVHAETVAMGVRVGKHTCLVAHQNTDHTQNAEDRSEVYLRSMTSVEGMQYLSIYAWQQ